MASRTDLQVTLERILGSRNVYYQPPASVIISYPAIVYSRKRIDNRYANNGVYSQSRCYEVTVIDKNPDSTIVDRLSKIPTCRHDRNFKSDNLNHDVFTIYY